MKSRPVHSLPIPFVPLAILFLAIASLTRLVLALYTGVAAVPPGLWPELFLRGIGFDLVVLSWILAPMLLWAALWPARWRDTRWRGGIRLVVFFGAAALLIFGAVAEWTFWEEFSTRFNFIAVDYLVYTHEVIGNIVESYPVTALLAGVFVLALGLTWFFRSALRNAPAPASRTRWRLAYAVAAFVLPWTAWHLGNIDQMEFSDNAYANELSGDGLMTFFAAYQRNGLDYDRFYYTLPASQEKHILAGLGVHIGPDSARRPITPSVFNTPAMPFRRPPRNVVLITVESLSARYLGSFGNQQGLTPRLDALARKSLVFTNLYAAGTRTVRGLDATTLGTPPIPGEAIMRRPGNDHLATLGEILHHQGYESLFIYGGYGYFDNMNAYYASNDYRVVDRTDFPKASVGFGNIWGVADEYLFDNSLTQLDRVYASGKPFLAQIMTTSNHRPYTYPNGRIDIPSPSNREGTVKYTDYAIGRFIEQASRKPWFKDTLFVIVADHCASAAGKTRLPVAGYRIPLIFYAPALLAPGRDNRLASQIDIPPTLLDVLNQTGGQRFFGQSLFKGGPGGRRAFISNYEELGYLKDGKLTVLGPRKKVETFSISADDEATPIPVDTTLRDEAVSFYQTTFRDYRNGALKMYPATVPGT